MHHSSETGVEFLTSREPDPKLFAEPTGCSLCQRGPVLPHAEKAGIPFVRCHTCGYVKADPMPSQAELDALYDQDHFLSSYHPDQAEDQTLLEQRDQQYLEDRDCLMRFVEGGKLLDFGCGNGRFLSVFPDSFEKIGYELNPVTRKYIRERAGFQVLEGEDELEQMPEASVDAVMMRGVIEHLLDPERIVRLLSEKLAPGGHFLICATPNMDSPCALVYDTEWNQFNPPYHLHYFSPRSLGILFARYDLALIESATPYLETPYANPDSDAQQFVRDTRAYLDGAPIEKKSAAFPGTMMTLVFRKV